MLKEGNPLSFSGLEVKLERSGREKREAREVIFGAGIQNGCFLSNFWLES